MSDPSEGTSYSLTVTISSALFQLKKKREKKEKNKKEKTPPLIKVFDFLKVLLKKI